MSEDTKKQEVKEDKQKVEWDFEAEKLWDEIKNLPIEMYSLPNQLVKNHVQRVRLAPDKLYLKAKSSAVITSLEDTLDKDAKTRYKLSHPKYLVEAVEGYIVVSRAEQPLPKVKPEP